MPPQSFYVGKKPIPNRVNVWQKDFVEKKILLKKTQDKFQMDQKNPRKINQLSRRPTFVCSQLVLKFL